MFLWISAFFFKAQMIAQAPGGCLKMVSTVIQETPSLMWEPCFSSCPACQVVLGQAGSPWDLFFSSVRCQGWWGQWHLPLWRSGAPLRSQWKL